MDRRAFLAASGAGGVATAMHLSSGKAFAGQRPNILLIMTDQQFGDGMSCAMGRDHLHTPHMDSLARSGVRFTRAYSPNPLCMPMRTSMITGEYPHRTGIETNTYQGFTPARHRLMGRVFRDAGYETAYFGKWHIPVSQRAKDIHGFDTFVERSAQINPAAAAKFLRRKHDRPFLAVASFLTPHEICEWARKERIPGKQLSNPPPVEERPPLRANFGPPENETDTMTHMRRSYHAWKMKNRFMFPVGSYTEADWRRLMWGYYRLIERADGFVGTLMGALRESGLEENTIVVFVGDHGDCHGAHGWNQKTVFYDESARVPFMISWKGGTLEGISDQLVNVGVDMIPTLCDLAGVDVPAGLPGRSMKAPALGNAPAWKRDYVVSQNHMVQCSPVDGRDWKPHGRMVRSARYKYCVYSEGRRRESLVDMENDPGEMVNLAGSKDHAGILATHRRYLSDWCREHGDDFARKYGLSPG